ncbi:hypothetical protein ScPMuIL_008675 [Solemya velum]
MHIRRTVVILLVNLYIVFVNSSRPELDTLVKRGVPGLESPKKLWWAKELTPDLHVAGRLTERQLMYAADGGFNSIVSLYHYTESKRFGAEYLPDTKEAETIARIAGLRHVTLLDEGDKDWASIEAVDRLTAVIPTLKPPVLLHCNRAYTITFVTLMYMANATRFDPEFEPKIDSDKFYRFTAIMGTDFTMSFTREVVAEITGEDEVERPIKPNADPYEWYDYWPAHPVYKNWYTAGQIRKGHLPILEHVNFTVINMRLGVSTDGKPTKEMVTLRNVRDDTPTYDSNGNVYRQSPKSLAESVIAPRDNRYISSESEVNYESTNRGEFGDEEGFNEDLERAAFDSTCLKYIHLPIASDGPFTREIFEKYKETFLEAGRRGPVLVHCAVGKRGGFFAVLAAALQYGKDMDWALKRIAELGFEVSPQKHSDVYKLFSAYLNSKNVKEEL